MRRISALLALTASIGLAASAPVTYPEVRPGVALSFPHDYGAHPAFRTEWWYVTGWLRTADGAALGFQVTFFRTRPPVDPANPKPQGQGRYSRKGPAAGAASHYCSIPHLRVTGLVRRAGGTVPVTGEAWLDREWSSSYLQPDAQGWDWTGINLDDGSALMALRIRRRGGGTLWAGGSLRRPNGTTTVLGPRDVVFRPLSTWRSPATGAVYPDAQDLSVRLPGGIRRYRLRPLFAAQELDARRSGLPVYWEGAVSTEGGRGYLELTGYDRPLTM